MLSAVMSDVIKLCMLEYSKKQDFITSSLHYGMALALSVLALLTSLLSCTESEVAVNIDIGFVIISWYIRGGHRGISLRLHIRSTSTS